MKDKTSRNKLITAGRYVYEHHVTLQDVEKNITNVTLKDAPVEVSDSYITQSLANFGKTVEGSLRRGTIKGTDIETGTNYLQLEVVKDVIPTSWVMGRLPVRIFCDNIRQNVLTVA